MGLVLPPADAAPGSGRRAVASITGDKPVRAVTATSPSGVEAKVQGRRTVARFAIPGVVCVPKRALNLPVCNEIKAATKQTGLLVARTVGYDRLVGERLLPGRRVVQNGDQPVSCDTRVPWRRLVELLSLAGERN